MSRRESALALEVVDNNLAFGIWTWYHDLQKTIRIAGECFTRYRIMLDVKMKSTSMTEVRI